MSALTNESSANPSCNARLTRIGVVAEQMGISERTVRYYEEFGLVMPSSYSSGGSRLYDDDAIARVGRIRALQSLMGFNLEEIRGILEAEDHIASLKSEYKPGSKSKREAIGDAIAILVELQNRVSEKQQKLHNFQDELQARLERAMSRLKEQTE